MYKEATWGYNKKAANKSQEIRLLKKPTLTPQSQTLASRTVGNTLPLLKPPVCGLFLWQSEKTMYTTGEKPTEFQVVGTESTKPLRGYIWSDGKWATPVPPSGLWVLLKTSCQVEILNLICALHPEGWHPFFRSVASELVFQLSHCKAVSAFCEARHLQMFTVPVTTCHTAGLLSLLWQW